jgi:ATP-binding cassette subfamily C protein
VRQWQAAIPPHAITHVKPADREQSMKLIGQFVVNHPWQSVLLMTLLLLAGLADGIGLSAMLPMLNLAFDGAASAELTDPAAQDELTLFIYQLAESLNLTPSLGVLLGFIVAGIGAKSLLVFLAEQRIGYLAADVATRLRLQLLRAVTASSWLFYVKQSVGRLANAMATEAWRASNAYVYAIRLLVVFIETLVYFVVALLVSWGATLTCVAAGLGVWAISHQFVKISRYAGTGQTRGYRTLLSSLTDILLSIKTLKSMGRERSAEALVAQESNDLRRDLRREVLGNAGLDAAQEPLYTLVIVVGIYLALVQFEMELATVTFLTLVLARLLKRGSKVQKEYQRMITCESAYWSLQETIDEAKRQAERVDGDRPPRFEQAIVLEDVTFSYPGGDGVVIEAANLTIPKGRITCLLGESGSGKSTIADLVIGLIRPGRGRILVDGVPLDDIDLAAWRATIGYVPQDNLLLHDTVLANVTLGDPALGEADVQHALEAAGAAGFIAAMPEGMHTVVGERGARLSGGQRQRVMIARALAHAPALLVLDEATSALDSASEADICETLAALKGTLTILAVTHQSALRQIGDRIYQVEGGSVSLLPDGSLPLTDRAGQALGGRGHE